MARSTINYGGEVYYTEPATVAALTFVHDLVHTHKVMPPGVLDPNGTMPAFFSGRSAMMMLPTGALGFVRDNMKQPYRVTSCPGMG